MSERDLTKLAKKLSSQLGVKLEPDRLADLVQQMQELENLKLLLCMEFLTNAASSAKPVKSSPPRKAQPSPEVDSMKPPTLSVEVNSSPTNRFEPEGTFEISSDSPLLSKNGKLGKLPEGVNGINTETEPKTDLSRKSLPTPREGEIVKLVAEGCSNKEIADELGISENTVKVHLRNLFPKVGVRNRAELAAKMFGVTSSFVQGGAEDNVDKEVSVKSKREDLKEPAFALSKEEQQLLAVVSASPRGLTIAGLAKNTHLTPSRCRALIVSIRNKAKAQHESVKSNFQLSETEVKIVSRWKDNFTNLRIRSDLNLSEREMLVYTQAILHKLGSSSLLEAVRVAEQAGLLGLTTSAETV